MLPLILNPVLSFVLKANNEKGANIGVHKHSPVLENTFILRAKMNHFKYGLKFKNLDYIHKKNIQDNRMHRSKFCCLDSSQIEYASTRFQTPIHDPVVV